MPLILNEREDEPNTDEEHIAVLAQAADAITNAKTINEAAELALNAACAVLPYAMFVYQIWHWETPVAAEFSLVKSNTSDNYHPSLNVAVRLLKQDSSSGAMPSKCQVILNQQEVHDLFPKRKKIPYVQGLKVILPRQETKKVVIFIALSGQHAPRLEQYNPFVRTLLNLTYMAESRIWTKQHALKEHDLVVRAKHEWQRSVDTLGQMMFLVDESGKIVRANKAMEQFGLGPVKKICGKSILELLDRLGDKTDSVLGPIPYQIKYDVNIDEMCIAQRDSSPVFTEWEKCWQAIHCWESTEWVITSQLHKRDYQVTMQTCALLPTVHANESQHALIVVEEITAKRTAERCLKDYQEGLKQDVKEKNVQLEAVNQRLKLLSKELIQTQEKERKRIASELHDGIGQMLSAIKLGIDTTMHHCQPRIQKDQNCELGRVLEKTREALDEVRRISMDLRPPMLDDLGILATLQWFFREYQQSIPHIQIHTVFDFEEHDITIALKTVIFRITQEALNNVFKHAKASRIHFKLNRLNSTICLSIKDNGQGFNKNVSADRRHGFGLNNMHERASISGGRLDIKSNAGAGVEINAEWPVGRL